MGRRGEHGFTLLEMIVVVAVLALVGTVVLSRGPSHSTVLDLRAAAGELAGFLRRARAEAIEADRTVGVTVRADGRGYGNGVSGSGNDRTLPARVAVARGADGRMPPPIVFHPDGSASGGRLVLGEDGRSTAVSVDWLTGAVSVS